MTAMQSPVTEKNTKKAGGDGSWAKGKTGNGKRRNGSRDKHSRRIERLLKLKEWKKANALIHEELVYEPTDHWLWLHLGLTYYEQKDYEKALSCSEWAVQLQSRCPLALWHLAGALFMTGSESAAVAVWTALLHMDIEEIAYGEHGEGMDWALQLANDVQYRLGRYYQRIGENRLAAESFRKYVHNRRHGVGSLYEVKEVEKLLLQVSNGS
jgi:tetratricopeptide (TPR) repeat protein